jgi:hypothetical protein
MKGNNTFTKADASAIKKYLDDIIKIGKYDSLTLSSKLRTYFQFYKSDFKPVFGKVNTFSSDDFNKAVEDGRIAIL